MRFSPRQIELIGEHWPGANGAEIDWFVSTCEARDLSPFREEIGMIGRWNKEANRKEYRPQLQIAGARVLAERTGAYAGSDKPGFEVDQAGKPTEATVTVYRIVRGHRCAFTSTARWDEFCPEKGDFMWKSKPFLMLGKCAESQALAKAFPGGVTAEAEGIEEPAMGIEEEIDLQDEETLAPRDNGGEAQQESGNGRTASGGAQPPEEDENEPTYERDPEAGPPSPGAPMFPGGPSEDPELEDMRERWVDWFEKLKEPVTQKNLERFARLDRASWDRDVIARFQEAGKRIMGGDNPKAALGAAFKLKPANGRK